jgi:hypothetical protein
MPNQWLTLLDDLIATYKDRFIDRTVQNSADAFIGFLEEYREDLKRQYRYDAHACFEDTIDQDFNF